MTNETGEYIAPDLEPGLYTVAAEAPGFKKTVSSVVRVEVTNDIRIDLRAGARHSEPKPWSSTRRPRR